MKLSEVLTKSGKPSIANLEECLLKGRITQHDEDGYFRLYPSEGNTKYLIIDEDDVTSEPVRLKDPDISNLGFFSGEVFQVGVSCRATIYTVEITVSSVSGFYELQSGVSVTISAEEAPLPKEDKCAARA